MRAPGGTKCGRRDSNPHGQSPPGPKPGASSSSATPAETAIVADCYPPESVTRGCDAAVMKPEIPGHLAALVAQWSTLSSDGRRKLGRSLRRLGLTYREIGGEVSVPQSTLSGWCRDIALTDEQVEAIKRRTSNGAGIPRDTQWKRREQVQSLRTEAWRRALELESDPLWVAGVALYWAEGAKTTRRLHMSNSDPAVLRVFMRWVEAYLDPSPSFRAAVWLHADNDEPAARRFWCNELGLDIGDFTKSYIKPDGTGHRKNHLAAGVCRVSVRRSADFWITTMTWCRHLSDTMGLLASHSGR